MWRGGGGAFVFVVVLVGFFFFLGGGGGEVFTCPFLVRSISRAQALSPRAAGNWMVQHRFSSLSHSLSDVVSSCDHLVGLVVKASATRVEDPGSNCRLRRDFSGVESYPVTSKLALQWLPCQAPGVIGSVLGLVGPVSVYCD